jgi:lysophospholipase L1-like esterase
MKRISFTLFVIILLAVISFGIATGWDWKGVNENKAGKGNWTGSWASSMQAPLEDGISNEGFSNQTVRMIVKPHIDGKNVRIRLSNVFSPEALKLEQVHIAVSKGGPEVESDTDQKVTFDGKEKVTIPAGETKWSDPLDFKVRSDGKLAVSVFIREKTGPVTWHPRSMQTNYITSGNKAGSSDFGAYEQEEQSWFWLDAVDVLADSSMKGSIVVLGSSIANGNHSTPDTDHRWPDYLANRMKQSDIQMSLVNAGISGNQLIESTPDKGESALERIERDVFDQTGIKSVILHQGLNDIRHHPEYSADDIIDKMKEIIEKTHDRGLKIYGGTLTPYKGSGRYTAEGEKVRQEVNDWIRTSGEFDGVIDFDKAVRDPEDPERYLPEYDAGDHLHPNDAGYEKMAEAVDLSMFK